MSLSKQDIDFDNYTIKNIVIADVFWNAIINALNTKTVIGRGGREIPAPEYQKESIIKYCVNDYIKVLKEDISKCKKNQLNKNIPAKLNITSVRLAGKWYRMYLQECNGERLFLDNSEKINYQNYKRAYWE